MEEISYQNGYSKKAITIDPKLLEQTDELVNMGFFSNRSKAIQSALQDKIKSCRYKRLATEAAKLDRDEEEWLDEEVEAWQEGY